MRWTGRAVRGFGAVASLTLLTTFSVPAAAEGSGTTAAASSDACVPGTWVTDPRGVDLPPERYATEHVAFRWDGDLVPLADAVAAGAALEQFWDTFLDPAGIAFPEPACDQATKYRVDVHVDPAFGLAGGVAGTGGMGMWINPGGLRDRWGLAHELTHALQGATGGLRDSPYTGMFWEMHANWMTHQLPEFRGNAHCSEDLVNVPHLAYGSSRNRYCNWQFLEHLKNTEGYGAVAAIWAQAPGPDDPGRRTADPWGVLAANQGWTAAELNDAFGRWAMHNVTWDYVDPDGTDQGAVYRAAYGPADAWQGERTLRRTTLDPVPEVPGRWTVPFDWAPQRWGYNLVRLDPEPGATSIRVGFRGLVQDAPAVDLTDWPGDAGAVGRPWSGWRWGVVVEQADGSPRYSDLRRDTAGELEVALRPGDGAVHLVVLAAPTHPVALAWDHPHYALYRYPWTVDLAGATPAPAPRPAGAAHPNGGGWVAAGAVVAPGAWVGPDARVLGGTVTGEARIEDHAVVLGGTVTDRAVVGGISVVRNWAYVGGDAVVRTTTRGVGADRWDARVVGTAQVIGDVELRAAEVSAGAWYGFVEDTTTTPFAEEVPEVTRRPTAADLAGPAVPEAGPGAGDQVAPLALPTASYTAPWNRLGAVNDGLAANTGGDQALLWGTWTGAEPETRWLRYTWAEPVTVNRAALTFWWDAEAGSGTGVAVPESWVLSYLDADTGEWAEVPGASGYPTPLEGAAVVRFDTVTTTALRVDLTTFPNPAGTARSAVAVSEWGVWVAGPDFVDVGPGHPFRTEIRWLADEGLAVGTETEAGRVFGPDRGVSRQAFAAFLHRLAGAGWRPPDDRQTFADVPLDHPFRTEIEWLAETGLTTGYADGRFLPDAVVSRQATAAVLHRLAGEPGTAADPGFADVGPDHPFRTAVAWAAGSGIATGYDDGTFGPDRDVSRQAMAAFLHRYAVGPAAGDLGPDGAH